MVVKIVLKDVEMNLQMMNAAILLSHSTHRSLLMAIESLIKGNEGAFHKHLAHHLLIQEAQKGWDIDGSQTPYVEQLQIKGFRVSGLVVNGHYGENKKWVALELPEDTF